MTRTKMTGIDETPPPTPVLRWIADTLNLYGLCGRPTCRRARACRGDAQDCLARYAPLVPEEAREGAKMLVDGLYSGATFDELFEEAQEEIEALAEWTALVKRATWKPARR